MLVIRKIERVPNTSVRKLWKVKKGVNEKMMKVFFGGLGLLKE